MRVLFTTWAWPSHLYALVPLAWAMRSAGHEVLVTSQPELTGEMRRTGLPFRAAGRDVDAAELVRGYVLPSSDGPDLGERAPAGATPNGRGPRALQMFHAHADAMTDDLVDLAREWRPDLIVYEPTTLAGPLAAAAVGVPAVRVLFGTDLMVRAAPMLPQVLAPVARRHGIADFDPLGAVTVDPCPPGFQVPDDHPRRTVRYVPYNGAGAAHAAPAAPAGTRRVVVTWGHTMAKLHPGLFLAGRAAAAVHDADTEVVLAVSAAQLPLLDGLPAGVRVVTDTPLHQLVPGADLVVAHGGAGTVLTALDAGVPLLLVPQLPDHSRHTGRVVATGAGESLKRDEASPHRLRELAHTLLAPGAPQRAAARRLRELIHAQPTPSDIVRDLEKVPV